MNVLILDDAGFGLEAGKGVYGKEIYCEVLARINTKMGNTVLKVVLGKKEISNADIINLKGSKMPFIRTFHDETLANGLLKVFQRFKIDLIHANILNSHYPLILSRVFKKVNLPLVITVHSWVYLCPTNYNVKLPNLIPCEKSSLNMNCIKCLISKAKLMSESPMFITKMLHQTYSLRSLLKGSDSIISPSKTFATKLYENLKIKAYHIPNPIILNSQMVKDKLDFESDVSILFIGRLEYEKGAHLILSLAKILKRINIHVIGVGKAESLFLANELSNVIYHGFVNENEKINLIRKAKVVIVPSIWCDMFAYTVSEAFSLGKPVVAFDLGGPKEQIEASGGGLLAKPFEIRDFADKITYLFENSYEAKRIGLMGQRWVEKNLNINRYAEMLNKVYEQAIMTFK